MKFLVNSQYARVFLVCNSSTYFHGWSRVTACIFVFSDGICNSVYLRTETGGGELPSRLLCNSMGINTWKAMRRKDLDREKAQVWCDHTSLHQSHREWSFYKELINILEYFFGYSS